MFTPVKAKDQLFRKYLKSFGHPAKIRMQNLLGRSFLSKGILFKNTDDTFFLLNANDWITRIFLLEGDYESGSTKLAKKIMAQGGVFVDAGANFGLFTCQVAHNNKKVQVLAIEPNYKIIASLLKNIELNNLQQQVKVINMAVSDKMQFVSMLQPAADNIGTTQTVAGINEGLLVLSSSLAYILEEVKIKEVALLKIDIEGNEFSILKHFPFESICIKNVIIEFNHLSTVPLKTLCNFFAEKGYLSRTIHGDPLGVNDTVIPENNIWFYLDK